MIPQQCIRHADGMTGESRQKSHGNAQVQNLDRFWALPLFSPTKDRPVIQIVQSKSSGLSRSVEANLA